MKPYDYIIVGGGIVGLSTAMRIGKVYPHAKVLVLEKEASPARHQTGRNSGVIHSGIYYRPGSFKARFAREGAASMARFCADHDIPHEICGKLVVATEQAELPQLEKLFRRGRDNGVPVDKISPAEAREFEPHVRCLAALRVHSTGITDYRAVALEYLRQIRETGGEAIFGERVSRIEERESVRCVHTDRYVYEGRFVINCAGVYSDRLARASNAKTNSQIVPFRGEYYSLAPDRSDLVRGLIYPVPNPEFPFLGVHFTRMIDGSVHAGPNAVLALAREGYRKGDFDSRDLLETLRFPGFWKLAKRHYRDGLAEMWRSASKRAFTRSLRRLIPEIREEDLRPCASGIRAQALTADGRLVDDFHFVAGKNTLHVCNAPSPAATASLRIGEEIVRQLPEPARHANISTPHSSTSLTA